MFPFMDKKESLELKGIAILLMLMLHLFNTQQRVAECTTFLYFWNGKPLVYALSRVGAFCVPLYIFISGYGHGSILAAGRLDFKSACRRVAKLYIIYWVVFLPFIGWGCLAASESYPGSASEFLLNFIGVSCSYNNEWWFLFSYVLLVLFAPFFLPLMSQKAGDGTSRIKTGWIVFFIVIFILCQITRPLCKPYFSFLPFRVAFDTVSLSSMFVWGAAIALGGWLDIDNRNKLKEKCAKIWGFPPSLCLLLIILVCCLLRMSLGPSFLNNNNIFVLILLPLYLSMSRARWWRDILCYFGVHSTNMWLCHTFFAYYICHDFIYGLSYPLLMFCVLVLLSLASSILLTPVQKALQKLFVR